MMDVQSRTMRAGTRVLLPQLVAGQPQRCLATLSHNGRWWLSTIHIVAALTVVPPANAAGSFALTQLSLENLMALPISTASRKLQPLARTPVAATVITADEIRRSGASSIPEALRLAPGIESFQTAPGRWSVTIRGFGGFYGNKILVLIDGRKANTSPFGGVYWEAVETPLNNIERIEVIRGPGTALWGDRAVNGVINIITSNARQTGAGALSLNAGDQVLQAEIAGAATNIPSDTAIKFWANANHENKLEDNEVRLQQPHSAFGNEFTRGALGFRLDKALPASDQLSLQGSVMTTDTKLGTWLPIFDEESPEGRDVLDILKRNSALLSAHYYRLLDDQSEINLRVSLNNTELTGYTVDEDTRIAELDVQHNIHHWPGQDFLWGVRTSYGNQSVKTPTNLIVVSPEFEEKGRQIDFLDQSLFIQDEIISRDKTHSLTLGLKWEKNQAAASKLLPQIRWMWQRRPTQMFWASVSRTTRSPSLGERFGQYTLNSYLPENAGVPGAYYATLVLKGSSTLQSEKATTWEAGFRSHLSKALTIDLALFVNDHYELRDGKFQAIRIDNREIAGVFTLTNSINGTSSGAEVYADYHPNPQWRLQLAANFLSFDLKTTQNIADNLIDGTMLYTTLSPKYQTSLRVGWTPSRQYQLDLWWRHIDDISFDVSQGGTTLVNAYDTLNLRAAWLPTADLEIALIGKNLLSPSQIEYMEEFWTFPKDVPRSVSLNLRYRFN
ncbi:MAG: TonB-dependent receptor plug domain-containing protein [Thiotrichales bacterium]